MSNFLQFFGGSGGQPIGSMELMPYAGDTYTKADGSQWLLSGKSVLPSAAPVAATLNHMMVSGQTATLPQASTVTDIACDSTGTYYVACYGNATYVLVSQNGGKTWANVAHNMAQPAYFCAWGLNGSTGTFVVAGNSATSITTAVSANNGLSFNANSATVTASATSNTARVQFGNSTWMVVVAGATTGAIATAPAAGTTFTAQNIASAYGGPFTWVPSAGLWLIAYGSGGNWMTSATGASGTWTVFTPAGLTGGYFVQCVVATATAALVLIGNSGNVNLLYRTTDCVNFVNKPITLTTLGLSYTQFLKSNGTTVYATITGAGTFIDCAFYTTTDCQTWTRRWNATPAVGALAMMLGAGSSYVYAAMSSSSASIGYTASWPNADYVGSTFNTILPGGTASAGETAYYRYA